jgi:AcrR family transcriptional regulator
VAETESRQRRDRGSISADEILTGAFEVAAQASIVNLSMPVMAKYLDVGVTSIYWYHRRKDNLLDAMTGCALEQFECTVPFIDASNWRESLRDQAHTMRRQYRDDTYGAISVHTRGSAVLERIQQKTDWFPPRGRNGHRYIGFADDIDFDYIPDSILDHALALIDAVQRQLNCKNSRHG